MNVTAGTQRIPLLATHAHSEQRAAFVREDS